MCTIMSSYRTWGTTSFPLTDTGNELWYLALETSSYSYKRRTSYSHAHMLFDQTEKYLYYATGRLPNEACNWQIYFSTIYISLLQKISCECLISSFLPKLLSELAKPPARFVIYLGCSSSISEMLQNERYYLASRTWAHTLRDCYVSTSLCLSITLSCITLTKFAQQQFALVNNLY